MDNSMTLDNNLNPSVTGLEIAIIGMAGRFPGADSIEAFWNNLEQSIEGICQLQEAELLEQGIDGAQFQNPDYVKAGGVLKDTDQFDAAFFGFSPREADLLDPQQRLFLECAWQALEVAGYDSDRYPGSIGVYGGTGMNGYLFNLYRNRQVRNSASPYELFVASDKDFLTTRVSYKLNLTGPSFDVQTACSTSLVAVHLACQSLLSGECDMALAGGVAVSQQTGYLYQEGSIYSPDGHCRAFDADAEGTVGGNGVGMVVLKRLEDALADGDSIDAVIKGSAINNDGAFKVSYTAPRIDTQAAVIQAAQAMAEVEPDSISYIEAHGTGTSLGDPIEIAALTQAFRSQTQRANFCALGSVKSSIGHLDAAAGVASLIKTVLSLKHGKIPASLHVQQPNPDIDWEGSPFFLNRELADWKRNGGPRRAGVSSFGIGGTNAHVILEEAPSIPSVEAVSSNPALSSNSLLPLSAKTETALSQAAKNLAQYLQERPQINLSDVAHTLKMGRREFEHRQVVACTTREEAIALLSAQTAQTQLPPDSFGSCFSHHQPAGHRPIVFMFPGQGSQHGGMVEGLYQQIPSFRETLDRCADILRPQLDLQALLKTDLLQTEAVQPALFAVEYALAELWMSWGIQPEALIGHSLGEYVAACLAGVFSLEDGLKLVRERGRLMQQMAPGAMLSVALSEAQLRPWLANESESNVLEIATINGPALCVVAGEEAAIANLQQRLDQADVICKRLNTSHAFHSAAMEPMLDEFRQVLASLQLSAPQIPMVSNVTGAWLTAAEATSPDYWVQQVRRPVQFSQGLATLQQQAVATASSQVWLEVGPGKVLASLAKAYVSQAAFEASEPQPATASVSPSICHSLPHPKDPQPALLMLQKAVGQLWTLGISVNWNSIDGGQQHRRIPLPTYPFERQRHWIEPDFPDAAVLESLMAAGQSEQSRHGRSSSAPKLKTELEDWFYCPTWERSAPAMAATLTQQDCWLIFLDQGLDESGLGQGIAQRLETAGQTVITVEMGDRFDPIGYRKFSLNPHQVSSYGELFEELQLREQVPNKILYFWALNPEAETEESLTQKAFDQAQINGFRSLVKLAQSWVNQSFDSAMELVVFSDRSFDVVGTESLRSNQATVQGIVQVLGQEYPQIGCRQVDLDLKVDALKPLVAQTWADLTRSGASLITAYRGRHRWQQRYQPLPLQAVEAAASQSIRLQVGQIPGRLKPKGCYLIAGDLLAGLGWIYVQFLVQELEARLVVLGDKTSIQDLEARYGKESVGSAQIEWVTQKSSEWEANLVEAIQTAEERFGSLDGIFFSTPTTSEKSAAPVTLWEDSHSDYNAETKIYPLQALAQAIARKSLDFCCIQSSLAAVIGGLGLAPYAAANCYMDAFVHQQNQRNANAENPMPWISINWDACIPEDAAPVEGFGAAIAAYALTPSEVWQATQRILAQPGLTQVAVSKGALSDRIGHPDPRLTATVPSSSDDDPSAGTEAMSNRHARPQLAQAYVPPETETEQTIVGIWQDLLGIEQVGIHDSFFDLGGHSLLAIQAISRLREAFQVEMAMRNLLFETPTVASIAIEIDKNLRPAEELNVMAELLAEVQGLSGEAVQQQLAATAVELPVESTAKPAVELGQEESS